MRFLRKNIKGLGHRRSCCTMVQRSSAVGELDVAYLVLSPLWPDVFENPDLQWDANVIPLHGSSCCPDYNLEGSALRR